MFIHRKGNQRRIFYQHLVDTVSLLIKHIVSQYGHRSYLRSQFIVNKHATGCELKKVPHVKYMYSKPYNYINPNVY